MSELFNRNKKIEIMSLYINDYIKEDKKNLEKLISYHNNMIIFNFLNLSFIQRRKKAYENLIKFSNEYSDLLNVYKSEMVFHNSMDVLNLIPSTMQLPNDYEINTAEGSKYYKGIFEDYTNRFFLRDKDYNNLIRIDLFNEYVKIPPLFYYKQQRRDYENVNIKGMNRGGYYNPPSLYLKGIQLTYKGISENDIKVVDKINNLIEERDTAIFDFAVSLSIHFISFRDEVFKSKSYSSLNKKFLFLSPYIEKITKENKEENK